MEPQGLAGHSLKTTDIVDIGNTELLSVNQKGRDVGVDAGLILK